MKENNVKKPEQTCEAILLKSVCEVTNPQVKVGTVTQVLSYREESWNDGVDF